MESATARVPATSANLGPGFDCLGVALQLYNRVTVRRDGDGPFPFPMAAAAAAEFFRAAGHPPFPFTCEVTGDVPRSRGLGSSVTVRMGLLAALNRLAGSPLGLADLYLLCARLEGHPDNAAPGAFGGFTAARADGVHFRCAVAPELRFVLLIPQCEIETGASRARLPEQLPFADAVHNAAHASLVTAAFASGSYELLRGSFEDRLHEPYRAPFVPGLREVVAAGSAAGALGGYLSGSGSAVACVTLHNPEAVAAAMREVSPQPAETLILCADNEGTVLEA